MADNPGPRAAVLVAAVLLTSGTGTLSSTGPGPVGPGLAPDPAAFAHPLPFFYDLYTFRGDSGTTVVAAFAVQAGDLEREHVDRGVRYRFDVSLVLVDTITRQVTNSHDSVYVETARPLPHDHLLYTAVEVQAPPSGNTIHRVLMFDATTAGIGQLYIQPFPIPDYAGSHLMLSDIALGQPEADIGWARGDVTLALLPAGRFPAGTFDAYYEIYNLPGRHPYETTIMVERVDEAGDVPGRVVDLRFSGESRAGPDAVVTERRRIESSLDRGRYRMTVTVTDLRTRQAVSRSRVFEVHSARGATMVPALNVARGGRAGAR